MKNKKTMIEMLIAICAIIGIIGAFFLARNFGFTAFANEPNGEDSGNKIEVTVEAGESISDVAKELEENGMIESGNTFLFRYTFSEYRGLLKEGTYEVNETMGIDDILDLITQKESN